MPAWEKAFLRVSGFGFSASVISDLTAFPPLGCKVHSGMLPPF